MGSTHQNDTSHDQYGPGGDDDVRDPLLDRIIGDDDLRDPLLDGLIDDDDLRDPLLDGLIDDLRWANPVDPKELPSAEDPAAKALLEEILKSGRDE